MISDSCQGCCFLLFLLHHHHHIIPAILQLISLVNIRKRGEKTSSHQIMIPSPLPISSVQFSRSVVSDSVTPWTAARQASLSIANSQSLLKPMPIESVMSSNDLILCHPLLLPAIFPSFRVFSASYLKLQKRYL